MRVLAASVLCLWATIALQPTARACSAFYLTQAGRQVVGQNYDWHVGVGHVIVNKKGLAKAAFVVERPATWTSRYGSVTVNQYGREFPCGGMNEAGLVVAVLWQNRTEYPPPDERPALNVLQWVQYQLDNAATVADVIASEKKVRIQPLVGARLHYFVSDSSGSCAAIEFMKGKMVHHAGDRLPTNVLTNSTYKSSLANLKRYAGFGGELALDDAPMLTRFVRAANRLRNYDRASSPVRYAFGTLKEISQGSQTKWSIVYDIGKREIHLRTQAAKQIRSLQMGRLDFSTTTPTLVLDVNADLAGDVARSFAPYSRRQNKALLAESARGTPLLKHLPKSVLDLAGDHPETSRPVRQP